MAFYWWMVLVFWIALTENGSDCGRKSTFKNHLENIGWAFGWFIIAGILISELMQQHQDRANRKSDTEQ